MDSERVHAKLSEQGQTDEALRDYEQRYSAILHISLDAIIAINAAQRITYFNLGAQRVFGHDAAEVIGKPVDLLLPTRFRDVHGGYVRGFADSPEITREMAARAGIRGVRKDGSEFPAEATITKLAVDGEFSFVVMLRDITERNNAETALRDSEARYRNMVEFSPDAILVQIDGRIVYANPEGAALYGAACPEELVGIAIQDLIHPDEMETHLRRRKALNSGTGPLEVIEQRRIRLDQKVILVESRGIPIPWQGGQAIVGVSRDISDRKRREEESRESEKRYRNLVEISPNAIWVIREGHVAFANNAMANLLGTTGPDELIGMVALEFLPEEDREQIQDRRRDLLDKNQSRLWIEQKIVRLDGAIVEVDAHATRIVWNEEPSTLIIFRDLTTRRLAEAVAREKEAKLRDLERKLSDLSRFSTVMELSSVLAHELNQPLAAIVNYMEAGREELKKTGTPVSEKADEMMEKALKQANRATGIFHNLRNLGAQGDTKLAEEDINEILTEVSSISLAEARTAKIEMHVNLGAGLPKLHINKIQIQQVILNLLRNGIEAMAECDVRELSVATFMGKEGFVDVTVTDTGPGLSHEIKDRLFEPFVSTKASGMGLGLAICHTIMESHGGKLIAAPNPKGGAIFHMALPFTLSSGDENGK